MNSSSSVRRRNETRSSASVPALDDEALGRATQGHEHLVIARVHRRTAPRKVGQDRDGPLFKRELPALGVVAGKCQRRETDKFAHKLGRKPTDKRPVWRRTCHAAQRDRCRCGELLARDAGHG